MRYRVLIFPVILCLALLAHGARAAETIPPSPTPRYIIDDARVLSPAVIQSIDQQLQQTERDTSNQIVVALYPKMLSDDDIAAYGVRVYQAWRIGQKGKDNGVLLVAFIQDRKMNITTGYGLEGALPDATCKQIIENEIKPHFKNNDYDGGIQAGVNAILAATRGEYKGNGQTNLSLGSGICTAVFILFIALIFISGFIRSIYGTSYSSGRRTPSWLIPFIIFSNMTNSRGSGGWSSGSGGSSGGGGFSGGGGSSGGGGASGSW